MSVIVRETKETKIRVELNIGHDEAGGVTVDTGVPFLDHMMITLARYSGLDMNISARGDLKHHTIEDVAIALGTAFLEIIPASAARYGDRTIPMDETLVQACVDIGGRPYYRGPLPSKLYDHWMRSFCDN